MSLSPLIDSHVHLQDNRCNPFVQEVLRRAQDRNIQRLFCNGTREDDWQMVLELAEKYTHIIPFIGIHPWHSDQVSDKWLKRLEELLANHSCGVGEIGIDRPCGIDSKHQRQVFTVQLEVAIQYKRPVAVHCVKYWGLLLETLETLAKPTLPVPVMIHSFSGSMETMQRLVSVGCSLSFSTRLCNPEQKRLRSVFIDTPLDNILLETDSPDQLTFSSPTVAGLNEPAFITELYKQGATLKKMEPDTFNNRIWSNATVFTDQITAG